MTSARGYGPLRAAYERNKGAIVPFSRLKINGRYQGVRGLLKPANEVFFSGFEFKSGLLKRGAGGRVVRGRCRRSGSSAKIGSRVHRELEEWGKTSTMPTKPHRYTRGIIAALTLVEDLEPVAMEFPILSQRGAYLTYSDMVCTTTRAIDGRQLNIVVSFKTGYNRTMSSRRFGKCAGALSAYPNNSLTHHQVQLACEIYTLKKEYGVQIDGGIIIYAGWGTKREVHIERLPQWCYSQRLMRKVHKELAASDTDLHKRILSADIPSTTQHNT